MINSEKLTESVLAAIRHQVTLLVEAEKVLSNAELASGEQIGIKILDSQITALEAELERYSNLKIRLYQDLCDDVVSREEYGEMNTRFAQKIKEAQDKIQEIREKKQEALKHDTLLPTWLEDESQQIYSFDKGYRCFSGKAPFIESEKIFREILSALEKEKMQAAHIDRVLDLNPEKVKQCMDAGLLQHRKRANEIVAHLMAKDDERTAVYRQYEQGSILLEQVEEYEHQYQVAVQKQEAAFKKVMLAVNDIEKAFSHGNPWLMKFRAISIPEKLERTHLKEWLDHVWIVDFEQVEVILQESEWKRFFPEEWLNNGEEDCNGKKE